MRVMRIAAHVMTPFRNDHYDNVFIIDESGFFRNMSDI